MYNTDLADMRTITNFLNETLEENIDSLDLFDKERAMKITKDSFGAIMSCVEEGDCDIISYMDVHKKARREENAQRRFFAANSL